MHGKVQHAQLRYSTAAAVPREPLLQGTMTHSQRKYHHCDWPTSDVICLQSTAQQPLFRTRMILMQESGKVLTLLTRCAPWHSKSCLQRNPPSSHQPKAETMSHCSGVPNARQWCRAPAWRRGWPPRCQPHRLGSPPPPLPLPCCLPASPASRRCSALSLGASHCMTPACTASSLGS